jgi:Ca2+-transporting ATPase
MSPNGPVSIFPSCGILIFGLRTMQGNPFNIDGLTDERVTASRAQHGRNVLEADDKGFFWPALKAALTEPMVLLLLAASLIYFILGQWNEGLFMVGAILLLTAISLYQDSRSRTALSTLKELSMPQANVVRNGQVVKIPVEDVVVGDHAVAEEGSLLAADGTIVQSNDFSVNESILTGEAFAVARSAEDPEPRCGTQGHAGGLGPRALSCGCRGHGQPLGTHQRIARFDRAAAHAAAAADRPLRPQHGHRWWSSSSHWCGRWISSAPVPFPDSLLSGLTLAMSILPEEIPVAFATFLALGAWRLARQGMIVKRSTTVETLGSQPR